MMNRKFNGGRYLTKENDNKYLLMPETQLASAIIAQALEDYRYVCAGKFPPCTPKYNVKETTRLKRLKQTKKEIEEFFSSDYFYSICVIDADIITDEVEKIKSRSVI